MNYYEEIASLIKRLEINKRARYFKDLSDTVKTHWQIVKLIVESQNGEKRAKYGDELLKKWSEKLTTLYGKGYNLTGLKRFRKLYLIFPKGAPVGNVNNLSINNCVSN